MQKLPLSLVIITLNEELNIERCIKSAAFVSEVLILDSGSGDRTHEVAVEVCQRLGLKLNFITEAWRGFGVQKRRVTELAAFDWILNLDADEVLSVELVAELQQKFSEFAISSGYKLPRKSFYLGRWIEHGGWYPDYQLRLYHRSSANWSEEPIHERVLVGQEVKLQWPILHYVFRDIAHQVTTNNRYSGLLAEADIKRGKRFSLLKLVTKPPIKFIECYFLKLGCCDGLPGFIIAVSAAYSSFLRWSKIWEIERRKS